MKHRVSFSDLRKLQESRDFLAFAEEVFGAKGQLLPDSRHDTYLALHDWGFDEGTLTADLHEGWANIYWGADQQNWVKIQPALQEGLCLYSRWANQPVIYIDDEEWIRFEVKSGSPLFFPYYLDIHGNPAWVGDQETIPLFIERQTAEGSVDSFIELGYVPIENGRYISPW